MYVFSFSIIQNFSKRAVFQKNKEIKNKRERERNRDGRITEKQIKVVQVIGKNNSFVFC